MTLLNKQNEYYLSKVRNNKLSKFSSMGKGLIAEQVVANYLCVDNLNIKYNNFNHSFDLFNDILGRINVKGRKLRKQSNGVYTKYRNWNFRFKYQYITGKNRVDTYFLIGFDEDRKNILRVWIIPNRNILKETFCITNTEKGLSEYKKYEIDAKPFNDILHKISKIGCPYLCDVNGG